MENDNEFIPYGIVSIESPVIEALKNANLSVTGKSLPKGYTLQGNLNTNIPLSPDSSVDIGISGMANKFGRFSEMKPTGVNAAYNWGDNSLGVEFNKMSPQQQEIFLNYIKQF